MLLTFASINTQVVLNSFIKNVAKCHAIQPCYSVTRDYDPLELN